jgi:Membrane carboxypeptidase (penicillin-binding protein)
MYLNTAEFGSNSYGIKVASDTYFKNSPSEFNYNEAAFLVGLINKPTKYNPIYIPEFAQRKRTEVLYNLYKYNKINGAEFDSLNSSRFGLKYTVENQNVGKKTYFRTVVCFYFLLRAKENGYDLKMMVKD